MIADSPPSSTAVADQDLSVLVVDDEMEFAKVVASYLKREGMSVELAFDGPSAIEQIRDLAPDLIVLDIMLPGLDGIEVCRQIRTFTDAYVIMLTARDTEVDKVIALSVGADDYMVKPLSARELVARAKAMLRRPRKDPAPTGTPEAEVMQVDMLCVDPTARTVTVAGMPVDLTRTEFDILAVLAAKPAAAFTRQQVLEQVWGGSWYGDDHVVDVHIGHIRQKLGGENLIRTVRGIGYGMTNS
jgi:DNA-binding response OmpR family regulator